MRRLPAFTILEVLVVVALVGVLLVPGFIAITTSKQNQELSISSEAVSDALRQAHSFSREAKDESTWSIQGFDTVPSTYILIKENSAGSKTEYVTYKLPSSVTFQDAFTVTFIKGTGETTDTTIKLINKNNQTMTIHVNQLGVISALST